MALTDYNAVVLRLLERNVAENEPAIQGARSRTPQRPWPLIRPGRQPSSSIVCGLCTLFMIQTAPVVQAWERSGQPPCPLAAGRAAAHELLWGCPEHAAALLAGSPGGFDLLLGADVIYPGSQVYLPELMKSLTALLSRRPGARLLLSYVSRVRLRTTTANNTATGPGSSSGGCCCVPTHHHGLR